MSVTLVRHCESRFNCATDEQKRVARLAGVNHPLRDADLTPKGEIQADRLAQNAMSHFPGARVVIVSPLRRALRTAIPIAAALNAKLIIIPALREVRRDVSDVGMPGEELDNQFPGLGLDELPPQWWMEGSCSDSKCTATNECAGCVSVRAAKFLDVVHGNAGAVIVSHSDFLNNVCGADLENGECAEYDPRREVRVKYLARTSWSLGCALTSPRNLPNDNSMNHDA
jgi:broad specificity phosphatase PhoE